MFICIMHVCVYNRHCDATIFTYSYAFLGAVKKAPQKLTDSEELIVLLTLMKAANDLPPNANIPIDVQYRIKEA